MGHRRKKAVPLRRHHIFPRSRLPDWVDKDTDNIVLIPEDFHAYWHYVFGVLTLEEAHEFIDLLMRPGANWTWGGIKALRDRLMEDRARRVA